MLQLTGKGTAHTCDGISRRSFLQIGALGASLTSYSEATKQPPAPPTATADSTSFRPQ